MPHSCRITHVPDQALSPPVNLMGPYTAIYIIATTCSRGMINITSNTVMFSFMENVLGRGLYLVKEGLHHVLTSLLSLD
jgi:hypothetical protein